MKFKIYKSIQTIKEKTEFQVELFEEETGIIFEGTFIYGYPFKVVSKINDIQLLFTLPLEKMTQNFPGTIF